jgi:hypothetical protein
MVTLLPVATTASPIGAASRAIVAGPPSPSTPGKKIAQRATAPRRPRRSLEVALPALRTHRNRWYAARIISVERANLQKN